MIVTTYDSTGKIMGLINSDPVTIGHTQNNLPDQTFIEGDYLADRATKYVLDGSIADRPANPSILTGFDLTSLPVPCDIHVNQSVYPCTDGYATLSFSLPGTYRVIVKAWPMLDKEFSIAYPA